MVIVQGLEVIDVHHEQRKLFVPAIGAFYFQIQLLLEVSPRPESRQIVGECESQQTLVGLFARQ